MKKKLLRLGMILLLSTPVQAFAIYCSNCSNMFVQALERVTSLEQLATLTNQYTEAIQQTAQQIQMVQNMIQNTASLSGNLKSQLSGQLS